MLDGVKWDRIFAMMSYVYKIRVVCIPPDPHLNWVVKNSINSYVLLPNGDVVYKTWGNNSGSGTTTGDNILGMTYCVSHSFYELGCTTQQINEFVVYLFGDDVMLSHNIPEDISDDQIEDAFRRTFSLYGVELDPFVSGRDLSQFTFLGFSFAKFEDYWVPKYPVSRLAFAFLHEHDASKPIAEISKMCSLMLMSAGNGPDIFNMFRDALLEVVINVDIAITKLLRCNNFAAVPTFTQVVDWYCGLEGQGVVHFLHTLDDFIGGDEEQNHYEEGRKSNEITR
jgi:hypothetical protein